MLLRLTLVAFVVMAMVSDSRVLGGCPSGWKASGQTCLKPFYDRSRTFLEAKDLCKQESGAIVQIHQLEKNDFVLGEIPEGNDFWLGLYDQMMGKRFLTMTGNQLVYERWDKNQPNNWNGGQNCVVMRVSGNSRGYWNDIRCNKSRSVVCETHALPTEKDTEPLGCPHGWTFYEKEPVCLKAFDTVKSFDMATSLCYGESGIIVVIKDDAKNSFTLDMLPDGKEFWIGIRDLMVERTFLSILDFGQLPRVQSYFNWDKDQPNNRKSNESCVIMRTTGSSRGYWDDIHCDKKRSVICEKPMPASMVRQV